MEHHMRSGLLSEPITSMYPCRSRRLTWAAVVLLSVGVLLAGSLRAQGRPWWCACGKLKPWTTDAASPHTSQHLLDSYSLTHVLHGLIFYGLLSMAGSRMKWGWRLTVAAGVEAAWEMLENSSFIIDRYRQTAIAEGYYGDSIVNSSGDLMSCIVGFLLARLLGFRGSAALFVAVEALLLLTIRDSLFLSGLMLVYPLDAIGDWQAGR